MDMVAFSRLMSLDDVGTLGRLQALRRNLIDPAIEEHGGRLVNTGGDSLLVAFDSVEGAVRYSLEVQEQVSLREKDQPEDRSIRFRVGVNIGDTIAEGSDVYGDAVNVAARLQAECPPSAICVSRSVRDHVHGRLGLEFEALGALSLKNIARPVEAYVVRQTTTVPPPAGLGRGAQVPPPGKPSIAVLAFTNMSGDPEQEYFSDGVADDIVTERVRSFFVIARNSSFTYKGRAVDVRQVARELGVRYVLEGGVRRNSDRLRVTAQLVDAETGNHLWADERPVSDLFALQDEIAARVAKAIRPAIAGAELRRALRRPPESLDAWDAYQKGLWHLLGHKAEDIPRARDYFAHALKLDPTLASAHTSLAWLYIMESGSFGLLPFEKASQLSAQEARKAVAADPDDADAHAMLAFALSNLRDFRSVANHIERALAISPSCAGAYHVRGMNLLFSGHPSEARSDLSLAIQLDPAQSSVFLITSRHELLLRA
jgi:adenylate cyclase